MAMNIRRRIYAKITVDGVHYWPDAKDHLQNEHRHLFTIEASAPVEHGNRAIEFLDLAARMRAMFATTFSHRDGRPHDFGTMSCEDIGEWLLAIFPEVDRVRVWEDGENSGEVCRVEA